MRKNQIASLFAGLFLCLTMQVATAKCSVWLENPEPSKSWQELQTSLLRNRIRVAVGIMDGTTPPSFLTSMELQAKMITDLRLQYSKTVECFAKRPTHEALDALDSYVRYRADSIGDAVTQAERLGEYEFADWMAERVVTSRMLFRSMLQLNR